MKKIKFLPKTTLVNDETKYNDYLASVDSKTLLYLVKEYDVDVVNVETRNITKPTMYITNNKTVPTIAHINWQPLCANFSTILQQIPHLLFFLQQQQQLLKQQFPAFVFPHSSLSVSTIPTDIPCKKTAECTAMKKTMPNT